MLWFFGAAIVVAAAGAWVDWRVGSIPSWLTLGTLGVAPVAHLVVTTSRTGHGVDGATQAGLALLGAALCALVPLGLFRAEKMGGGDVKLFAALGAVLLPSFGLEAELWSLLFAGVAASVQLAWRGRLFATLFSHPRERGSLEGSPSLAPREVSQIRLGPSILLGTAWTAYLHWHG